MRSWSINSLLILTWRLGGYVYSTLSKFILVDDGTSGPLTCLASPAVWSLIKHDLYPHCCMFGFADCTFRHYNSKKKDVNEKKNSTCDPRPQTHLLEVATMTCLATGVSQWLLLRTRVSDINVQSIGRPNHFFSPCPVSLSLIVMSQAIWGRAYIHCGGVTNPNKSPHLQCLHKMEATSSFCECIRLIYGVKVDAWCSDNSSYTWPFYLPMNPLVSILPPHS